MIFIEEQLGTEAVKLIKKVRGAIKYDRVIIYYLWYLKLSFDIMQEKQQLYHSMRYQTIECGA